MCWIMGKNDNYIHWWRCILEPNKEKRKEKEKKEKEIITTRDVKPTSKIQKKIQIIFEKIIFILFFSSRVQPSEGSQPLKLIWKRVWNHKKITTLLLNSVTIKT